MSYLRAYGTKAYPVLALMWWLIAVSVAVVLIIGVLVLWGVLAKRKASVFGPLGAEDISRAPHASRWIGWGVAISTVPLVVTVVWTAAVLAAVNEPSRPAPFTIEITGHQWWWQVRYLSRDADRTITTANEIHIPTGRPVRVLLKSGDVIHSFWIPALTGKTDTIPGRTNVSWLEADQAGIYRGQCTEYCGRQHAHMAVFVVADRPGDFTNWWNAQIAPAAQPTAPDAMSGRDLFVVKCGSCHTVRGTDALGTVAPDLTHLMSRRTIAAGAAPNSAAGLSGWIANPQGIKPGTTMPTLYLSGSELQQVRAYLETLK
ncbi:MAG TPA: cytochrome c oxidase subunit II [Caulobacteraceae bacterium]|nr:cytochrome c oxidase subunit II [Caulobacteraceae bacterium]